MSGFVHTLMNHCFVLFACPPLRTVAAVYDRRDPSKLATPAAVIDRRYNGEGPIYVQSPCARTAGVKGER